MGKPYTTMRRHAGVNKGRTTATEIANEYHTLTESSKWDWEFKNEKLEKTTRYKGNEIKIASIITPRIGKLYYATLDSGEPYATQPPLYKTKEKALSVIKKYVDWLENFELNK